MRVRILALPNGTSETLADPQGRFLLSTKGKGGGTMHPFYGPNSELLEGGSDWWLGLASMAMYLLFWGIVIFFAVKFVKKYFVGKENPKEVKDDAMEILRIRYAKGEIDAEEFKQKKADLE